MTPAQFRSLALSIEGAEEHSHVGHPDFRLPGKGRIFASLQPEKGLGTVRVSLEQQGLLVDRYPDTFVLLGGWSKDGWTGILLADAKPALVKDLLRESFASLVALKAAAKRPKRRVASRK